MAWKPNLLFLNKFLQELQYSNPLPLYTRLQLHAWWGASTTVARLLPPRDICISEGVSHNIILPNICHILALSPAQIEGMLGGMEWLSLPANWQLSFSSMTWPNNSHQSSASRLCQLLNCTGHYPCLSCLVWKRRLPWAHIHCEWVGNRCIWIALGVCGA